MKHFIKILLSFLLIYIITLLVLLENNNNGLCARLWFLVIVLGLVAIWGK